MTGLREASAKGAMVLQRHVTVVTARHRAITLRPGEIQRCPGQTVPDEQVHASELITTAKSLMSAWMILCRYMLNI